MEKSGFRLAEAITKKYAKTFYFASRFLKKEKRNAAYAIYAICRLSDEAVDGAKNTSFAHRLAEIQKNIDAAYGSAELNSPLLAAFRQTVAEYQIPREYFTELISGMHMDLEKNRYADFNQLYDYCYKVAGVVGLIMLQVFGCSCPAAKEYAVKLGIAMQLTNILRDIKEDFGRGRIYLPLDETERFGVTESDLSAHNVSDNFKALLKFQIQRAQDYYQGSKAGIKLLAGADSRFVASIMANIYSGILTEIEKNDYDVFSRRAQLNNARKCVIALKTLLQA
ncbi:MAG: phytoene/squalene synthase family protein [Candidatus Omnitrophica bacterium]|nr:phytoene/squalene synthase family protein [Candidatus Omnitrophota bacterium]